MPGFRFPVAAAALVLLGCQATTTRPTFRPLPAALSTEVRLSVPEATRVLAQALRQDSIPMARVEPLDGYLESPWFDTAGLRPTGRPQLGQETGRVRAWVDPGKPGPPASSRITVETAYRAYADPSRDPRETERLLPEAHAVYQRVLGALIRVAERHGDPATLPRLAFPAAPTTPVTRDTT